MKHTNRTPSFKTFLTAFGIAALALSTGTANAGSWRFHLTPYAWATGVGVDVKLDGRDAVAKDIAVSDLLEDLETIFMGRIEATHGEFGAMVDLFDVNLADQANDVALPEGNGTADIASELGMTILDVAGTYDPLGDRQGLALMGGTRILRERTAIVAGFEPAPGVVVARSHDAQETLVDALIGARWARRFAPRWTVASSFDVTTGGTDYTWSVAPTLSYAFGPFGRYGVNAGYRRMTVDFKDEDGVDTQMTLSGALLGFRISF
jgi:hypothetical protein